MVLVWQVVPGYARAHAAFAQAVPMVATEHEHAGPQPPRQVFPLGHTLPQVPQLLLSCSSSTHVPLQTVEFGQAQLPFWQTGVGCEHGASAPHCPNELHVCVLT
jgi:hypothetical protein